jgi:hypothetical protein
MKTDDLVRMLSTNVEAVSYREPQRMILISAGLGAVTAVVAMLLFLGVRTDLSELRPWQFIVVKSAFSGAIIGISLANLTRIARPGGERRVSIALGLLPFAGALIVAIASLAITPMSDWTAMIVGQYWLLCLLCIPLNAIIPFAAIIWAMRQLAPTNLMLAGAMAGRAAGGISAFAYSLHCTDDSFPFIALWYSLTIALCAVFGGVVGQRLLRW